MSKESFFDDARDQSLIKARIVSKYFWVWAKVVIPTAKMRSNRIAYVDLFAGPGRYKDGTSSTPLRVVQQAIADPDMSRMLVTMFNDKDEENASSLKAEIDALPGVKKLKYEPKVHNEEVGTEIVKMFSEMSLIPTFFFVDPWGYKGLSLGLVNSVLKDWGCDCVFFFNYNRVNMGMNNDSVREHMDVLFGHDRANTVRAKLDGLNPSEREALIVEELSAALKEMGANFVLPFTFKNERGTRTTHHLIFASKAFKGYEIMKGIMAKESSEHTQGVPSFEYSPASEKFPLLFELWKPLEDLEGMLLREYAGQKLTMNEIYMRHNIGRRYIKSNYKKVLASMEAAGRVKTSPPAEKRPKRSSEATFADHVLVAFPKGRPTR
jgi:three-Cys-motif partner protein